MSCPAWLPGPKLRSYAKAVHLHNCDLSPAPCDNIVCPSLEYYELIAELLKGSLFSRLLKKKCLHRGSVVKRTQVEFPVPMLGGRELYVALAVGDQLLLVSVVTCIYVHILKYSYN